MDNQNKSTADLLHERKSIHRKLAEYRDTLIEMKRRIKDLEAKENAILDELHRRGE